MNRQVMPTEGLQVLESPPRTHQDYPVDVLIRIRPDKSFHVAEIHALGVGRCETVPIEMSLHDLKGLNRRLQDAMQAVVSEHVLQEGPTSVRLNAQLRRLAEEGNLAFKEIFKHRDAWAIIKSLRPLLELLELTLRRTLCIQVASESFFLPWELIYPVSLNEQEVSYKHFWGMKYLIHRVIVQGTQPGAYASPVIGVVHQPKVGLLVYCGLPGVREKEILFFEKLDESGKIALSRLRALNPEKKREEFEEFKSFWDRAFNLAHFACHGFYEDGKLDRTRIVLSDDFPISLRDMKVYFVDAEDNPLVIEGHPLIMMNACETGNMNPLYTSDFARAFLRCGVRGVVATECAVPDTFAADFAEQLYTHLLGGKALGESLLATRRHFVKECHNPSGLLYSMYAPPSTRLSWLGG